MNKTIRFLSVLALVGSFNLGGTAQAADLECKLKFTMSGWSAFYKCADGTGTITCNNGQSMAVKLAARGGGLTAGKSTIRDGRGEFAGVHNIDEVLGSLREQPEQVSARVREARERIEQWFSVQRMVEEAEQVIFPDRP